MAYIYQIRNNINGKIYIGKTESSIEKRFQEHCRDSRKENINRPLYAAMRKYGIEHFRISLLEETDNPLKDDIKSYCRGARCTFKDFVCTSDCCFKEGKLLTREV